MTHLLAAVSLLAASSSTKKTSSGSLSFFLVIILIFGALYFFVLRPRQQQARKTRDEMSAVAVGDDIVTIGGIVGRIVDMSGDRVTIETGPDVEGRAGGDGEPTRLVMLRSAIARKVPPPTAEAPGSFDDHVEADHDDHDQGDSAEAEEEEDGRPHRASGDDS